MRAKGFEKKNASEAGVVGKCFVGLLLEGLLLEGLL